jgi:hypothetical protein
MRSASGQVEGRRVPSAERRDEVVETRQEASTRRGRHLMGIYKCSQRGLDLPSSLRGMGGTPAAPGLQSGSPVHPLGCCSSSSQLLNRLALLLRDMCFLSLLRRLTCAPSRARRVAVLAGQGQAHRGGAARAGAGGRPVGAARVGPSGALLTLALRSPLRAPPPPRGCARLSCGRTLRKSCETLPAALGLGTAAMRLH